MTSSTVPPFHGTLMRFVALALEGSGFWGIFLVLRSAVFNPENRSTISQLTINPALAVVSIVAVALGIMLWHSVSEG